MPIFKGAAAGVAALAVIAMLGFALFGGAGEEGAVWGLGMVAVVAIPIGGLFAVVLLIVRSIVQRYDLGGGAYVGLSVAGVFGIVLLRGGLGVLIDEFDPSLFREPGFQVAIAMLLASGVAGYAAARADGYI